MDTTDKANLAGLGVASAIPLTLAALAPAAVAGGAVGGLAGTLNDDDERSTGEKLLRGAGTGAATGIGATLGAGIGAIAGGKAYGGIGLGAGGLAGGILAYLLARHKKKKSVMGKTSSVLARALAK